MTLVAHHAQDLVAGRRRPLAQQLRFVILALFGLDLLVLTAAVLFAWSSRDLFEGWVLPHRTDAPAFTVSSALTPWLIVIWVGCVALRGGYRRRNIGAGFDEFRIVVTSTLLAFGGVAGAAYLTQTAFSRSFLILSFLIGLTLLLVERYAVRKAIHALRRRGHLRGRVLAVCNPGALSELTSTLDRLGHIGYHIVGTCLPDQDVERNLDLPVPCYGGVDDVERACAEAEADLVIVGGGGYSTSRALQRIGWALEGRRIDLVVVPGLVDIAGPRIHLRHLSGLPLVHVEEPQVSRAGGLAKRAFDVALAGPALVVLGPVMLLIALCVKLQDGGPVLFRQVRSGRKGEAFPMTKFRSMAVDAESRLAELMDFNDVDDVLFKMRNDPRVTPLGRFLRRFSLDELPQLVDVLRGDMSLVGPRPPLPGEVERYPADMHRRLLVRPGLTGLWQVSGRSDLSFDEAVRMDLHYVDNWSITGDVIILLKTARAVLRGGGAY